MHEVTYASATALARAIRAKEVSAVEVIQASLQRIAEVNPALNAVVQLCAEAAQAQARAADVALAREQLLGPLHGVPMTIKDSLDTAGVITTGGTQGRATFVPAQDAPVVARLRTAGAILLGKTNTPELTLAGETDNVLYGRTNNPYDLSRTPGGSSGGAAAIVAAGGAPFDIGSDTAASIRWPAHCGGIAGLKPTAGRVPWTGHIIPFGLGARDLLTQNGPMTRFVEDLSLILPIICGPDGQDPAIIPMPLGDPAMGELTQLRVAVHTDNGIVTPTVAIQDAVRRAAQALTDAGVAVDEAYPQALGRAHTLAAARAAADGALGCSGCWPRPASPRYIPGWCPTSRQRQACPWRTLRPCWKRLINSVVPCSRSWSTMMSSSVPSMPCQPSRTAHGVTPFGRGPSVIRKPLTSRGGQGRWCGEAPRRRGSLSACRLWPAPGVKMSRWRWRGTWKRRSVVGSGHRSEGDRGLAMHEEAMDLRPRQQALDMATGLGRRRSLPPDEGVRAWVSTGLLPSVYVGGSTVSVKDTARAGTLVAGVLQSGEPCSRRFL